MNTLSFFVKIIFFKNMGSNFNEHSIFFCHLLITSIHFDILIYTGQYHTSDSETISTEAVLQTAENQISQS